MFAQVLFSSVAALLGSPGQSSYAAANGSLDGLACVWQREGTPSTAIQWGPWANLGMAAGSAGLAARARQWGLGMLGPDQGLAALGGALASRSAAASPGVLAAAQLNWPQLLRQRLLHGSQGAGMFKEFAVHSRPTSMPATIVEANEIARISSAQGAEAPDVTLERMKATVHAAVSSVLGSGVSSSQPLMAAGKPRNAQTKERSCWEKSCQYAHPDLHGTHTVCKCAA